MKQRTLLRTSRNRLNVKYDGEDECRVSHGHIFGKCTVQLVAQLNPSALMCVYMIKSYINTKLTTLSGPTMAELSATA